MAGMVSCYAQRWDPSWGSWHSNRCGSWSTHFLSSGQHVKGVTLVVAQQWPCNPSNNAAQAMGEPMQHSVHKSSSWTVANVVVAKKTETKIKTINGWTYGIAENDLTRYYRSKGFPIGMSGGQYWRETWVLLVGMSGERYWGETWMFLVGGVNRVGDGMADGILRMLQK